MGRRLALVIGNSIFRDPTLARLLTPDADVGGLADVLLDPEIGAFDDVNLVVNMAASSIRRSISQFFANKTRDDLLLLYFSGHGVLDEYGRLYLATKETEHNYLRGTAIPTSFITDEMDHSRSRRQVLVLDCCHSGAFARGSKGATGASVGTAAAFEGKGYGRVVLTASDATQYAWEGDQVIGEAANSVFTYYLIEGMQTGKADADADGEITVDELYDYVYARVVTQTPKQTPGKWSYREQGEIVIARAPGIKASKPVDVELPEFDEEIEAKLKHLYDTGLAAYWLEEWGRAAQAFQAIVEVRPEYPGVADKLQEARRQAELAELYEKARTALESEHWDSAIAAFKAVVAQAPEYRDAASQLELAEERKRLAELYGQASSLAAAEKWQAARRALGKIAESAPDYADRKGLKALVDEKIATLERQQRIENLYSQALKEIDAAHLDAARQSLSQLQEMQPGYAETERLLAKVESEIERQAEERRRQEQTTALYRQAESLARAGQWPQVLSKMQALRQISPGFEDPADLFASARRQVELAEKETQRQENLTALYAQAVQLLESGDYQRAVDKIAAIHTIDPHYPDRKEVHRRGQEKLAGAGKEAGARHRKPFGYLREHMWLILGAVFLVTLLAWGGLNADQIFPPPVKQTPSSGLMPAATETIVAEKLPEAPTEPASREEGIGPIGGQVNVMVIWDGPEMEIFQAVLDPFRERTGVMVEVESARDLAMLLSTRVQDGNPPDLAGLPGPGQMAQFAEQGALVDLSNVLDMSTYNGHYARTWSDLGTVEGKLVGIFLKASVKGLIWYDPKVWQANNYQIPATWDDMMSLSNQIADSGSTPWCVALESGAASGWPGTDWLEDIVLRQAGEQIYNDWWQGNIPWTSPEIKQAWETWGQIVADPRMVYGGANKMLTTNFGNVGDGLFTDLPNCYMAHQGSFIPGFFQDNNPGVQPVADYDFFGFPPYREGAPVRTEIAGDLFGMFNDTPQAESLIKYLVTPEAQNIWVRLGGAISPNRAVPLDAYPDSLNKKAAQRLTSAEVAVFDASDLMPPDLNGEFWQAVQDYVRNPQDLGAILQHLEDVRTGIK